MSWGAAAAGASILGTGLSMFGQIKGGEAEASRIYAQTQAAVESSLFQATSALSAAQTNEYKALMSGYQAQVARNNAIIATQNADYEIKVGHRQAEMQSLVGAARVGATVARQAASGVQVNTGTNVDVVAGDRAAAKLDTETVMSNQQLRAYGYRVQSTNFEAQAGLDEAQGELYKYGAQLNRQEASFYQSQANRLAIAGGQAGSAAAAGGYLGAAGTLLGNASSLAFKWSGAGGGQDVAGGSGTLW